MSETHTIAMAEKRKRQHEELVKSGKAVDVVKAMARCFSGGNHGTERISRS